MHLTWRDGLATVLVVAAAILYLLWLQDVEVFGLASATAVASVALVLGFVACATNLGYNWGELSQGSRTYFAVTSLLGLAAVVAGIWAIVSDSEPMLGALVLATAILWVMTTARHVVAAGAPEPRLGHAA